MFLLLYGVKAWELQSGFFSESQIRFITFTPPTLHQVVNGSQTDNTTELASGRSQHRNNCCRPVSLVRVHDDATPSTGRIKGSSAAPTRYARHRSFSSAEGRRRAPRPYPRTRSARSLKMDLLRPSWITSAYPLSTPRKYGSHRCVRMVGRTCRASLGRPHFNVPGDVAGRINNHFLPADRAPDWPLACNLHL